MLQIQECVINVRSDKVTRFSLIQNIKITSGSLLIYTYAQIWLRVIVIIKLCEFNKEMFLSINQSRMYVLSQSTAHIPASLSSSEKPPELFPKNIANTSRLETTATLGS